MPIHSSRLGSLLLASFLAACGAGAVTDEGGGRDAAESAAPGDAATENSTEVGAADSGADGIGGLDTGVDSASDGNASASGDASTDGAQPDADAAPGHDDSGTAPPLSCAAGGAGLTNCGTAPESCCTSTSVASGTFFRTYANTGSGPTGEADPAAISAFRLDKYPVTVGRFRRFVVTWNAGAGWFPPSGSGKHVHLNGGLGLTNSGTSGSYEPGWVATDDPNVTPTTANLTTACSDPTYATWTAAAGTQENLPINCVNWYEAYAFCIWDGAFLPSEAESEYAAAGGSQQREYPWGSTAPGTANQYAIYGDGTGNCYYPSGSGSCTGVSNIAPVGTASAGAGLWGQLDLAGGLFQWGLDWYAGYAACTDCAYLTPSTDRAGRGGFFNNGATYLAPAYRLNGVPTYRGHGNGFRCARAP